MVYSCALHVLAVVVESAEVIRSMGRILNSPVSPFCHHRYHKGVHPLIRARS